MSEVYVAITTLRPGQSLGPMQTFRPLRVYVSGAMAWEYRREAEATLPVEVAVHLCRVEEQTKPGQSDPNFDARAAYQLVTHG